MNRAMLFASLAGGLAMYVWSSVAHMALPLASIGISQIQSNEGEVLSHLKNTFGDRPGLYMFPSLGEGGDMKAYDAKLLNNPSGLLIYHPPGGKGLTPGQLIGEFLVELLEVSLAVWLLSKTRISSYGGRVWFLIVAGLVASLGTNLSYWIWYGFPGSYTAVYMLTQLMGFAAAGLVASALLRKTEFSGV